MTIDPRFQFIPSFRARYGFLEVDFISNEDLYKIVERYRITLGLLPWKEWRQSREITGLKSDPGTGKTTLGVLTALGVSHLDQARALLVIGYPRLEDEINRYAESLGVKVQVQEFSDPRGLRKTVILRDHYADNLNMSRIWSNCHLSETSTAVQREELRLQDEAEKRWSDPAYRARYYGLENTK